MRTTNLFRSVRFSFFQALIIYCRIDAIPYLAEIIVPIIGMGIYSFLQAIPIMVEKAV